MRDPAGHSLRSLAARVDTDPLQHLPPDSAAPTDTCLVSPCRNKQPINLQGGATFGELDYINEGRNQDEFNAGFADNAMIYVPKVYWDSTSQEVLTSEWIDGEQLAKSSPDVINGLIPVGVECTANMMTSF